LRTRAATVVLVVAVTLTGCASLRAGESDSPDRALALWSARTEFVGDNSRVADLVDRTGFGPAGTYSLSLQTQRSPYAITVAFDHLDKAFDDIDFTMDASLMLGLVENLDQVSVTLGSHSYSLTADDASAELGYDVKALGHDKATLQMYLDLARD
jgi:hypothetical protein